MSYTEDDLFQDFPDQPDLELPEDPFSDDDISAENPDEEEEDFTPVRTFDDRIAYNSDFKNRAFSEYPEHRSSHWELPERQEESVPESSDHRGLWTLVTVVLIIGILFICFLLIRLVKPDLLKFLFQPE